MKIIEVPSNVTGHRFRQDKFLIWVAENKTLTIARLWARILSPNAQVIWYVHRERLQESFKALYEEYCGANNIDLDEVIYDNLDNTEQRKAYIALANKQITNLDRIRWDVIECINIETGEAEAMHLHSSRVNDSFKSKPELIKQGNLTESI